MITKKPFIGIEAEGPLRGTRTLFIPGSCTEELVTKVLMTNVPGVAFRHIYYCAGEDWEWNFKTFAYLCKIADGYRLPLTYEDKGYETPGLIDNVWFGMKGDTKPKRVHRVLLFIPGHSPYSFLKSIFEHCLIWHNSAGSEYRTDLNDPLFQQDREVL